MPYMELDNLYNGIQSGTIAVTTAQAQVVKPLTSPSDATQADYTASITTAALSTTPPSPPLQKLPPRQRSRPG